MVFFARDRNSAGECYLDMVEVVGSNPIDPRGQSVLIQGIGCPFYYRSEEFLEITKILKR